MGYRDSLKLRFARLDALAALRSPVSALLGVSDDIEALLGEIGIVTVFDLAVAPLFRICADIAAAAEGAGNSVIARVGQVPGSAIAEGAPAKPVALAGADVAELREIGTALANDVKTLLQTETVGDLGRWPAFRAAQAVLAAAVPIPEEGDDEAQELVPKLGEYPTERRYYRSVVIDHVTPGQTRDLATSGPVDLAPAAAADFGFSAPAIGAILTLQQSWFAQGVTLGNLLHSVALAPGESTRIAVLDWARRTVATGEENITEAEKLTNVSTHNRSISEIQDAVAEEVQSGFSRTAGSSTTKAAGGGLGLSIGPVSFGASGSIGKTTTEAESFSSSAGSRNLSASMNQRVADATQQAASSVRERRASIVKEVSEEEHEAVSTRIIANYNHMHALTVQYFEVIEIYRVNVQISRVERCLFVPMKLVTFTDAIIERFQGVLADAALDRRARELLSAEFGMVRLQSTLPMRKFGSVFDRVSVLDRSALTDAVLISSTGTPGAPVTRAATGDATPTAPAAPSPGDTGTPPSTTPAAATILTGPPVAQAWSAEEISRASRIILCPVGRPGQSDLFLPGDTEVAGISFALTALTEGAPTLTAVQVVLKAGGSSSLTATGPVDWVPATPIPLQEIDQIRVSSPSATPLNGNMTLQMSFGGVRFPISVPVNIPAHANGQTVGRVAVNDSVTDLRIHLEQHRLHYSQAIWRSLDSSTIALLLSGFSFEGMPVADQIDPNPVLVAGNYLVFRMPGFVEELGLTEPRIDDEDEDSPEAKARKAWKKFLTDRGLILGADAASEQLVPIGTGGVFAEAVLGRSNSAERLDATRFWNWQDSPIPLQPPEISAIQLQSRAQPVDATPGQLGQPVLNILNPTALPDPTGVGAILGALQNGNMFRDMSGLAATAGLAQSLSSNATSASTEAGRQAAANLAVAAQKDIEEKRIAAQLALAAMGMPAANAGTPKNISESGALLNTAGAMDKQAPRPGTPSGSSGGLLGLPGVGGGTSGGAAGDSGSTFDGSFMPGVSGSSNGITNTSRADDVLSKMTFGNLGVPGSDIILASSTGKGTQANLPTIIIFEVGIYATFPRPWADEAAEVAGIQANDWLPAAEDFDAIGPLTTGAIGGTKPFAQGMNTFGDIVQTVTFFAPNVSGFGATHPSRIKRLNLFFYCSGPNLEFSGTLRTNGTHVTIFNNNAQFNASVLDASIINNIQNNNANSAALTKVRSAWMSDAEIWLYTASDVPSDALAQAFAKLMGAKVRAFTEPFWVLPRFDPVQKTILAREEFGIGATFSAAAARRTKVLHNLDPLATRSFSP